MRAWDGCTNDLAQVGELALSDAVVRVLRVLGRCLLEDMNPRLEDFYLDGTPSDPVVFCRVGAASADRLKRLVARLVAAGSMRSDAESLGRSGLRSQAEIGAKSAKQKARGLRISSQPQSGLGRTDVSARLRS